LFTYNFKTIRFGGIKMKKRTILFLLILFSSFSHAINATSDSISTIYTYSEFTTQYQTKLKVSNKITNDVADYLVNDFHNSPENLFNWALKDLGLQNKSNELIIVFKSSTNDTKTDITHGIFDIVIPNFTTFGGIKVDAIVSKTKYYNGETKVTANIIYSSLLMKNALGTLTIIPQINNEQLLITNVKIRFGWFFNLFITKNRYRSIVQWRIKKFTENFKNECLKRQKPGIN